MSYSRFGRDGIKYTSDVYVYLDVAGYLRCCACSMRGNFRAFTTAKMIGHLDVHRDNGDVVPDECYSRLRDDAVENDRWMFEESAASNGSEVSQ